jgi:hypothetical protein
VSSSLLTPLAVPHSGVREVRGLKLASLVMALLFTLTPAATYAQQDGNVDCGFFGPHYAEAHCPSGQRANCWCKLSFGGYGNATCSCEPVASTVDTTQPVKNCSIPAPPGNFLACAAALVSKYPFFGCTTNCSPGYYGVCLNFSCDQARGVFYAPACGCAVGAGLLSGGLQPPHGHYTEFHFNSGPGNQNARMSIWKGPAAQPGMCPANSTASECAQAFASLAIRAGMTAVTEDATVRVITPGSPGWSIDGTIVDCPRGIIKKQGRIECKLNQGEM